MVKEKTSPDLKNLGIFAAEIRDREVKLLPGSIIRSRMDHIPAWNVNTHTLSSEERRSCRFWKPACVFFASLGERTSHKNRRLLTVCCYLYRCLLWHIGNGGGLHLN